MIRFPQKHIADQVAERIAAIQKEMSSVEAQGHRLDAALQAPVGDVAPIEGIEDAIPVKALRL